VGSPRLFNDIFGVNLHEFEASILKVEREFNKQITGKYKRPGRLGLRLRMYYAKIRVFKILSDRYRRGRGKFNERFEIIAGIVNLKSGFGFP
jgi:hypothetical protein